MGDCPCSLHFWSVFAGGACLSADGNSWCVSVDQVNSTPLCTTIGTVVGWTSLALRLPTVSYFSNENVEEGDRGNDVHYCSLEEEQKRRECGM